MVLARVRSQPALQADVDRLTADVAKYRAESSKLAQRLHTADETIARQRLDINALRNALAGAVASTGGRPAALALASLFRIMTRTLHAGELTVLTGPPPFDAGIACFILESDPANPVHAELVMVATTQDRETWKKNTGKASNELRRIAKSFFQDPGGGRAAKSRRSPTPPNSAGHLRHTQSGLVRSVVLRGSPCPDI